MTLPTSWVMRSTNALSRWTISLMTLTSMQSAPAPVPLPREALEFNQLQKGACPHSWHWTRMKGKVEAKMVAPRSTDTRVAAQGGLVAGLFGGFVLSIFFLLLHVASGGTEIWSPMKGAA